MRRKAMHQLTVSYSETLPDAVGNTQEQFELEAKWAMAVKLFEMKRISAGMAAALIGVDPVTVLLKLADYGVAMLDLSEAELLSDVASA
jgi:predicted HTH domain antitoxin